MIVKAEFFLNRLFVATFFTIASSNLSAADISSQRERLLFDSGWKFHPGNEWGFAQSHARGGNGNGPLGEREQPVFRVKIQMSEQDLAVRALELRCGKIDENGRVYVNDKLAGAQIHDKKHVGIHHSCHVI